MQVTGELYMHNKISCDLPMAAFSVYPGNKENRMHFTVRWDVRQGRWPLPGKALSKM